MSPAPDAFELIEPPLGRGGMGVVWRARNVSTGEAVALKRLHAHLADEPEYAQRFEREIEFARRIDSPHTVRVLGYGVSDGIPFAAMELVEGESLRELLVRDGPLSWERAWPIIDQIAAGLRDAHAQNVVHRDIKPSNVLVQADGAVKVADFGISRALDLTRLTGSSTMLGTPAYAPPDGEASEAGDYYSLGCVAYELLTGAPPFEGTSQQELWLRHYREEPDLSRLPREARPLVSALLTKSPTRRMERVRQLTDWFGAFRSQRPTNHWRWGVASAIGGVLFAVLAGWSWLRPICACLPPETVIAATATPSGEADFYVQACWTNPSFHGDTPDGPIFYCNPDGTVKSPFPEPPTRVVPTDTPTPSPTPTRTATSTVAPTVTPPSASATPQNGILGIEITNNTRDLITLAIQYSQHSLPAPETLNVGLSFDYPTGGALNPRFTVTLVRRDVSFGTTTYEVNLSCADFFSFLNYPSVTLHTVIASLRDASEALIGRAGERDVLITCVR